MVRKTHILLSGLVFISLAFGACSPAEVGTPVLVSSAQITLTPYHTPTHTSTALPPEAATETPLPAPTATPRIHAVQSGETLLEIAARYGVTYEAIMASNPSISPSMLSVGEQLVIPEGGEPSPQGMDITPLPLTLISQACYPAVEGGAWCLARVKNELGEVVEGVVLEMRLLTGAGEQTASRQAPAPLNVLPAGSSLPVGNYFPAPLPDNFQLQTDIKYAIPYADNGRYLAATIVNVEQLLEEDGRLARVTGSVQVENPERLKRLVVLAAAYGADDDLLGMRLWQAEFQDGAGAEIPFELALYSLAGKIEHIEWMAEAEAE